MWVLIARTSNSAVLATGGTAESLEVHCRAAGQRTRQRTAAFCFASLCCLSLSVCMRPVALFLRFRISLCNIECSNNCCDSATRGTRFRHARNARFRHANFRVPPQSWNDRNARFRMFRVACSTVAELVFRHGGMRRKTSSGCVHVFACNRFRILQTAHLCTLAVDFGSTRSRARGPGGTIRTRTCRNTPRIEWDSKFADLHL